MRTYLQPETLAAMAQFVDELTKLSEQYGITIDHYDLVQLGIFEVDGPLGVSLGSYNKDDGGYRLVIGE